MYTCSLFSVFLFFATRNLRRTIVVSKNILLFVMDPCTFSEIRKVCREGNTTTVWLSSWAVDNALSGAERAGMEILMSNKGKPNVLRLEIRIPDSDLELSAIKRLFAIQLSDIGPT